MVQSEAPEQLESLRIKWKIGNDLDFHWGYVEVYWVFAVGAYI